MREDVKKFLFIGLAEEKAQFFKQAQAHGLIHFIDSHMSSPPEIPQDIQRLTGAIKILRTLPFREQDENIENENVDDIVDHILRLHEKNELLLEELRILSIEKARIEVFGDFSLEDIAYIEKHGNCKIQFFCTRPGRFIVEPEPENLIYIASQHGLDYYVAINDHPVVYEKVIQMKIEASLGDLKQREAIAKESQYQIENQLKGYTKANHFLHLSLIEKLNHSHLSHAQTYVQQTMDNALFAIEGWVPAKKIDQMNKIVGELVVHFEEIAIEPTDSVPTFLDNHGFARLGEDLVQIYDTPSINDKDPSKWVLGCFVLFFSFIIGDAGYGFVYLALALILRYKFPDLKGMAKRSLNLFTILCFGCLIWGTLMTSFFGMQIALDNPIRKVSLIQWLAEKRVTYDLKHQNKGIQEWIQKYPELKEIKDPHQWISYTPETSHEPVILNSITNNIMFELALFIGVVHLITSLFRYLSRQWHQIGWIAFLMGGYLYFPYYLGIPSFLNFVVGIDWIRGGEFGYQLMLGGIAVALALSIIRNGWKGIFEIMVLIQVFADTLSYLRLYALGLAGAIVASTVNEIASGMPLLVGAVLILISHFINIVLATQSGVIHGLRLNFLEWYHYSFEGGGKRFQPFKLLTHLTQK